MKKTFFLIPVMVFALVSNVYGQKPSIELTFMAQYQSQHVMLDSIYIENLTQGGDTMLYAPDTVLVLDYTTSVTANPALSAKNFRVAQNRPNPFTEQTLISIFLPEADYLQVSVINLLGQKVTFFGRSLNAGSHSFVFYPGDDKYYILTATANGLTNAIKMVSQNSHSFERASLIYQGPDETYSEYKNSLDINDFQYSLGDQLLFIGFAKNPSEITGSDVIEAIPAGNEEYVFEIIEGIPCPGTPYVTYEGQTYKTVQIGDQCWFKENLNVGIMIDAVSQQTNNSQIEKYCYYNDLTICTIYGGLYQWDELMQYTTLPGTQGICPSGWHLPSDPELTTLSDFLGGLDVAGGKMRSTGTIEAGTGLWYAPNEGATNSSGFTALPAGNCHNGGNFFDKGEGTTFWASTEQSTYSAWIWYTEFYYANIYRALGSKSTGFSVRCVRD